MQVKTIKRITGIILLLASSHALAEPLIPDPAWKQGTLANGMHWQILATPQRPTDRIEVRLSIKTGSLNENSQQTGYSRFLPRLALTQNGPLTTEQARALWRQSFDPQRPTPPAITSYSFTLFNLSLPNDRGDLLKNALTWLAGLAGNVTIDDATINNALHTQDMVASWPPDSQSDWWRYRLRGSNLLRHNPHSPLQQPVDVASLNDFYQKWYTPDSMTLIIVGNIDGRALSEQIIKNFSALPGKRETPAPVPTLAPLPTAPVALTSQRIKQDNLALMWDTPWQQIRDSDTLLQYWQADLARDAIFQYVQHKLLNNPASKATSLKFDCQVLWQYGQCAMTISAPDNKLQSGLEQVTHLLAQLRDNGLSEENFSALIEQQQAELKKLFTTYAHTDTKTLITQRLLSLRNQVVDIAPEQYQKLRQQFLNGLTSHQLNQSIHQQLTRDTRLILFQPPGEAPYDMRQLQTIWQKTMTPASDEPDDDTSGTPPEPSATPATPPSAAIPATDAKSPEPLPSATTEPAAAVPATTVTTTSVPAATVPTTPTTAPPAATPASPDGE